MKILLTVMAVAAAVLLIKPNKIANETLTVTTVDIPTLTEAAPKNEKKQEIKKLSLNKSRIVSLVTPVDRMSADKAIKEIKSLQNSNEPIYLLLDSPGGSVFDGAQVISTMEASKAPVYTVCMRMCASMAFVIHQYGIKRMAVSRSILMAHPASGGMRPGQLPNMLSLLKTITRYIDKMDAHIAARAGLDVATFHSMIAHELWMDAEDATASKFNDEIVYISNDLESAPEIVTTDERLKNIIR